MAPTWNSACAEEWMANLFEVRLVVSGEPTDVAVTGRELSSGREARAEHELMAGTWHSNDLARMQVYSAPAGSRCFLGLESRTMTSWTMASGSSGNIWSTSHLLALGSLGSAA